MNALLERSTCCRVWLVPVMLLEKLLLAVDNMVSELLQDLTREVDGRFGAFRSHHQQLM